MKSYPIIDLHEDLLLAERDSTLGIHEQTSRDALEISPVKVVLATGFTDLPNLHVPEANDYLDNDLAVYQALEQERDFWSLVRTFADLEAVVHTPSAQGIVFHIEGLNAITSSEQFEQLDAWYARGLRSIGMVWNESNAFGGGMQDPDQGLTDLGRGLIAWCERTGVIVDLAHMNRPTFWDALEVITKPPVVTHTAAADILESPRNLTDEQLRAVSERHGIIGMFLSRKFTVPAGREHTTELVFEHLEHVRAVAGIDVMGIGSDYGGVISGAPIDMPKVTDLDRLTNGLLARGWTDEELMKLTHQNALRVLGTHLS